MKDEVANTKSTAASKSKRHRRSNSKSGKSAQMIVFQTVTRKRRMRWLTSREEMAY